ncbi:MAG: response regulator [Gemmatimonadales bacterium]|nr:MAG: response regulator [Gemmatimonadales bacterium]
MSPTTSRSHPTPRNPVRILLVEDDLDQAHLVKFLLEAGGDYSVTLVQDGDRAIDLLREREWELLITDLNLPGADGTAVVDFARTRQDRLPILATTGYTGPEYAQRAIDMGADDVLVKPLDRDELIERVRTLIQSGRPDRRPSAPVELDRLPAEPPPDRPPEPEPQPPTPIRDPLQILAIGVRPGDVEAGCGGTLLRHLALGDGVVVLHLTNEPREDGHDPNGVGVREVAREAGRLLGVRIFVGNVRTDPEADGTELERLAGGAVREIAPDILYVPSSREQSPVHRAALSAATRAASGVPSQFGYDSGTVSPDFAPHVFVPLSDADLDRKVTALAPYQAHARSHLAADFVRASARFWGRYSNTPATEAFELLEGAPPFTDAVIVERADPAPSPAGPSNSLPREPEFQ